MKAPWRFVSLPVLFSGLFFLSGCNMSPLSSDDDGKGKPVGELQESMAYTVSGAAITSIMPGGAETMAWCWEDSLMTDTYTWEPDTDVVEFELNGDALTVIHDTTALPSGAVIVMQTVFAREGSGEGLQGFWTLRGPSYRVITGELSTGELTVLERDLAEDQAFIDDGGGADIEFTASTIRIYTRKTTTFADEYSMFFNEYVNADSRYDVTLAELNSNTIVLTGHQTGEAVTVSVNGSRDLTFSSNVPAHTPGTVYQKPSSCPNVEPGWLVEFMNGNAKGPLHKKTALTSWKALTQGSQTGSPFGR
ncbi:hypothetical protein ACFL5V_06155 [Fibrobacterota bacterium]